MAHSYSEDSGICDLTCLENHSAPAWPQEVRSYMALCIRAERTCMNMREHALNRHQEKMYTEVWRRGGSSNCASWQADITHWMEQEKLWKYRRQFSLLQFWALCASSLLSPGWGGQHKPFCMNELPLECFPWGGLCFSIILILFMWYKHELQLP